LIAPDIESKVRVTVAITTLLLGALDVGNTQIAKEGIMEMILVMAGTEEELQQVNKYNVFTYVSKILAYISIILHGI
jgi:DUF1009 family protein